MFELLTSPAFFVTYALIQAVVFLLLVRFADYYEKEPLALVALMVLWGGTFAVILAIPGNEAISAALSPEVDAVYGAALSAPLIEEITKGLALVLVLAVSVFVTRKFGVMEFDGLTDGLVYGMAVGVGFAFTENVLYLLNFASEAGLREGLEVFLLRNDFFGTLSFTHPIFTGAFGAGLGLATWSRSWLAKIGWALLGFAVAMLLHGFHNSLPALMTVDRVGFDATADAFLGQPVDPAVVEQVVDAQEDAINILGYFYIFLLLLLIGAIWLWLRYQAKVIRYELAEEANSGLITREEFELVPRIWGRVRWYIALLQRGRADEYAFARLAHMALTDLALTKWRLRRVGGDWSQVERRRRQIAALRAYSEA